MVELNKKYQIRIQEFGFINWLGFRNLWIKECNRFIIVWHQTLLSPLVSSLLFLSVLSLALGNNRGEVLGYSFISFLAPGLIAMGILAQSFSHSVLSLIAEMPINNILFIFIFGFLSAFILGSLGFITGLWAIKLGLKI
ncbi:hypothetical protein N9D06_02240 [Candidatus Pelagibacter sp.]|nr:hypothetical protein [Candidatus Pelagibacter sp.]